MKPSRESDAEEYLAGFVLGELSEDEMQELNDLTNPEHATMVNELERVAMLAAVAAADPNDAMPDRLRLAIAATGRALVSQQGSEKPDLVPSGMYRALRVREKLAWLACLAASILALIAWLPSRLFKDVPETSQVSRQSLIASATDLIETSWTEGKTPLPTQVTGDVVWSNSAQRGFMRFVDLPINDPSVEQYQLWIIDPSRDDEPIDGGVFNITSSGESIVPIQAKLAVGEPKAFAITIEKPGGVVVSTQERLPLLAMVH